MLVLIFIISYYALFYALNTVFDWVDFREDGKHREEKWVENSVFHCLAKGEKYRGWKTREKIFSPGPQKNY